MKTREYVDCCVARSNSLEKIMGEFGELPKQRVPFGDRLSGLCAMELRAAKGNSDKTGEMIERLLNALAFTIAIAARGDPKVMSEMLEGTQSYLFEAAAGHQKMGQFMSADPRQ